MIAEYTEAIKFVLKVAFSLYIIVMVVEIITLWWNMIKAHLRHE